MSELKTGDYVCAGASSVGRLDSFDFSDDVFGAYVEFPGSHPIWFPISQLKLADPPPPVRQKPSYTLLPWDVLDEVSQIFAYGAAKYAPNDWATKDNGGGDHLEAALRHIVAHMRGDTFDDPALGGSGLRHLSHATARLMMCIGKEMRNG